MTLDGRVKPAHGDEMNYSSRFWLYAPITTFLIIACAVMAYWWVAADAFEKKLAALKGHEAIPGITLDWSKAEVGGFPFRLDADFTQLTVTGAGAHGPFIWSSEKFAAHTLTYNRAKAVYEAAGRQQASWTDAQGAVREINFLPGSLRASSVIRDHALVRADLDIANLGAKEIKIGRFQLHMRRTGHDLDLMLEADAAGDRKQVQAYVTLARGDAFAGLLKGTQSWPDAAKAWRGQGGAAKFSKVIAPGLDLAESLSPLY
ncbi:MAG: DUF2125 domain-containing protein [Alphaproteobacteria bacterium]|nr:DUF2125 domain-containing protein [Alphaproteobacteria bacterium]